MTEDNYIESVLAEYDNLFGENHHKICEGKKCQCHKEVKAFLRQALNDQKTELTKEPHKGERWRRGERRNLEYT
jgi:hypothetical protein